MKRLLILLTSLTALLSCSPTKTAGSASVTTNGTVAGIVTDSLGHAIVSAKAYLIPANQDPSDSASDLHPMMQSTDTAGKYLFDSVPAGDYRLVVRLQDSTQAATVSDISVTSSATVNIPAVPLLTVGAIKIFLSDFSFAAGDRFYLPGTDIEYVAIASDVAQGWVLIDKVPAGGYDQVMCMPKGSLVAVPLVRAGFQVPSAVYTLVPNYEQSVSSPIGFFTHGKSASANLGGAGGDTVTVKDSAGLAKAVASSTPKVVLIQGIISGSGGQINVNSNISVIGLGDSAGLDSLGLHITEDSNIIIQNLNFHRASSLHAITVEQSSKNIWIDHNSFEHMAYDHLDLKRGSDFITVSWNHFHNVQDMGSVGNNDTTAAQDSLHLHVTFHHNWFDHVEGACPRVRFGTVHVFNNYYDTMDLYGVASSMYAKVVVEENVFEKVAQPTVLKYNSLVNGDLVEHGNIVDNSGSFATQGTAFDPSTYYSFTPDSVGKVVSETILCTGVGRLKSLR